MRRAPVFVLVFRSVIERDLVTDLDVSNDAKGRIIPATVSELGVGVVGLVIRPPAKGPTMKGDDALGSVARTNGVNAVLDVRRGGAANVT